MVVRAGRLTVTTGMATGAVMLLACVSPVFGQELLSDRERAAVMKAAPASLETPDRPVTSSQAASSVPVVIPPLPSVDDRTAGREAGRLAAAMREEVIGVQPLTAQQKAGWIKLAQDAIAASDFRVTRAQVLTVVNRNPKVQRLALILALPDSSDWQVIGSVKVSTGTTGRKFYYITPTGVFPNSPDRLGYRAEGTKNENGIRGIGAKGMRVWDFGWHNAVKGWRPDGETGDIRLEMHATDPDFLESRLGHPASEGCVRIPATFNVFMDRHGLLDVEYEQAASYDDRFRALLRKDRTPSPIAGEVLVVVDSGETKPVAPKMPVVAQKS